LLFMNRHRVATRDEGWARLGAAQTLNKSENYSPSGLPYVVHISDPPTTEERLQLAACRLLRQPIVLVPGKCLSIEEWIEKYGEQGSADRQ
jgi:hypothetical protein